MDVFPIYIQGHVKDHINYFTSKIWNFFENWDNIKLPSWERKCIQYVYLQNTLIYSNNLNKIINNKLPKLNLQELQIRDLELY